MATPLPGAAATPLSSISTSTLLNGLGNNNVSSGFSSLAQQSLVNFANSGPQQSQMFQLAAQGSPANAQFLMTLNQSLSPAQGQVAGALQLVNQYQARKAQQAALQQQQLAALTAQLGAGGPLGNLANPSAIGGGIIGQLAALTGGLTGAAPAAGALPGAPAGGDIGQMLQAIISALGAAVASGAK